MAQKKASTTPKLEFKSTAMGEVFDDDGVHLGITNFAGSDGVG
jgi:hypothetical protein